MPAIRPPVPVRGIKAAILTVVCRTVVNGKEYETGPCRNGGGLSLYLAVAVVVFRASSASMQARRAPFMTA